MNGIIDTLVLKEFPHHYALLTVAALLRAKPNEKLHLSVQFGGTAADIMRESGSFFVMTSPSGTYFLAFHMPALRFDEPGEYVARVSDLNDEGHYTFATKYIRLATP